MAKTADITIEFYSAAKYRYFDICQYKLLSFLFLKLVISNFSFQIMAVIEKVTSVVNSNKIQFKKFFCRGRLCSHLYFLQNFCQFFFVFLLNFFFCSREIIFCCCSIMMKRKAIKRKADKTPSTEVVLANPQEIVQRPTLVPKCGPRICTNNLNLEGPRPKPKCSPPAKSDLPSFNSLGSAVGMIKTTFQMSTVNPPEDILQPQRYATILKTMATIHMMPLCQWQPETMDAIMQEGELLRIESQNAALPDPENYIIYNDFECKILREFEYESMHFHIELTHKIGLLDPTAKQVERSSISDLYTILKQHFIADDLYGIILLGDWYLMIWRHQSIYFLADFYGRRVCDFNSDRENGFAMVISLREIENVMHLISNLSNLADDTPYSFRAMVMVKLITPDGKIHYRDYEMRPNEFRIVNDKYAYLTAHLHLCPSAKFGQLNRAALPAAIAALVAAKIDMPCTWSSKELHSLMSFGFSFCTSPWEHGLPNSDPFQIDSFPTKFQLGQFIIEITIHARIVTGTFIYLPDALHSHLSCAISEIFEAGNHKLILQIKNQIYSIWFNKGFIYLFDPFPHRIYGSASKHHPVKKMATLRLFRSLKYFLVVLNMILGELISISDFYLHAVQIKHIGTADDSTVAQHDEENDDVISLNEHICYDPADIRFENLQDTCELSEEEESSLISEFVPSTSLISGENMMEEEGEGAKGGYLRGIESSSSHGYLIKRSKQKFNSGKLKENQSKITVTASNDSYDSDGNPILRLKKKQKNKTKHPVSPHGVVGEPIAKSGSSDNQNVGRKKKNKKKRNKSKRSASDADKSAERAEKAEEPEKTKKTKTPTGKLSVDEGQKNIDGATTELGDKDDKKQSKIVDKPDKKLNQKHAKGSTDDIERQTKSDTDQDKSEGNKEMKNKGKKSKKRKSLQEVEETAKDDGKEKDKGKDKEKEKVVKTAEAEKYQETEQGKGADNAKVDKMQEGAKLDKEQAGAKKKSGRGASNSGDESTQDGKGKKSSNKKSKDSKKTRNDGTPAWIHEKVSYSSMDTDVEKKTKLINNLEPSVSNLFESNQGGKDAPPTADSKKDKNVISIEQDNNKPDDSIDKDSSKRKQNPDSSVSKDSLRAKREKSEKEKLENKELDKFLRKLDDVTSDQPNKIVMEKEKPKKKGTATKSATSERNQKLKTELTLKMEKKPEEENTESVQQEGVKKRDMALIDKERNEIEQLKKQHKLERQKRREYILERVPEKLEKTTELETIDKHSSEDSFRASFGELFLKKTKTTNNLPTLLEENDLEVLRELANEEEEPKKPKNKKKKRKKKARKAQKDYDKICNMTPFKVDIKDAKGNLNKQTVDDICAYVLNELEDRHKQREVSEAPEEALESVCCFYCCCEDSDNSAELYPGMTDTPTEFVKIKTRSRSHARLMILFRNAFQYSDRVFLQTTWNNFAVFRYCDAKERGYYLYAGCFCHLDRFRYIDLSVGKRGLKRVPSLNAVIYLILYVRTCLRERTERNITHEQKINEILSEFTYMTT